MSAMPRLRMLPRPSEKVPEAVPLTPTSSSGGVNHHNNHGVMLLLLSLVVCSQVGYQWYMRSVLIKDADAAGDDELCRLGGSADDPNAWDHCEENRLFHGWHAFHAGPFGHEMGLDESPLLHEGEDLEKLLTADAVAQPPTEVAIAVSANVSANRTEELPMSNDTTPIILARAEPSAWGNGTAWSKSLELFEEDFDARMKVREAARRELRTRTERHLAVFRATMGKTSSSLRGAAPNNANVPLNDKEGDHMTAWARELEALQEKLEARLRSGRSSQQQYRAADRGLANDTTAWAQGLVKLQEQFEQRMKNRNLTYEHSGTLSDSFTNASNKDIAEIQRQLTAEMDRWHDVREQSDLLVQSLVTLGSGANGSEWGNMTALAEDLVSMQEKLDSKLKHPKPSEGEPARGRLRGATAPLTAAGPTRTIHHSHELEWEKVLVWKKEPSASVLRLIQSRSDGVSSGHVAHVRRSLLHVAHWAQRAPKVACVALVPRSPRVRTWMRYFIDNFKLQKYEGELELILVYEQGDHQASLLVQKYADGITIKAGTVSAGSVPSTLAFRYGSWLASKDAEVTAHWDFFAWYHPERIAIQMRALAYRRRPACMLDSWTSLDDSTDERSIVYADSNNVDTLVGEASWMRRYWFPMQEHAEKGHEIEAQHLVRVEHAAELMVHSQ